jgi:glutathione peroxidase
MATALQDIPVDSIDDGSASLGDYAGSVLLVVNVASKCGLTPQYEGLEALYQRYSKDGLVVLGFPANNFGGQEPGSNEEIAEFCSTSYSVTFPLFAKISVVGEDQHPLYAELTSQVPTTTARCPRQPCAPAMTRPRTSMRYGTEVLVSREASSAGSPLP